MSPSEQIRRCYQLAGGGGISWRPPAYSFLLLLLLDMVNKSRAKNENKTQLAGREARLPTLQNKLSFNGIAMNSYRVTDNRRSYKKQTFPGVAGG